MTIGIDLTFAGMGGFTEEPTLNLRFMHGRLQQMWILRGTATAMHEWRDVPDATPAPATPPTASEKG